MDDTITGYLLTRGWRDTTRGIELTFWCATADGPVRLVVQDQEAVCFIARNQPLALPQGTRRQPRDLKLLDGSPVDALYFRNQRTLQSIRQTEIQLAESDVKPSDRYLMERFIATGIEAKGAIARQDGIRTMVNPQLRRADFEPQLRALSLDIETRGSSDQLYSVAGAMMPMASDSPESAVFMIGNGDDEVRDGYTLRYYSDERRLLAAFFEWLHTLILTSSLAGAS